MTQTPEQINRAQGFGRPAKGGRHAQCCADETSGTGTVYTEDTPARLGRQFIGPGNYSRRPVRTGQIS
jgi:hypothetical protein